MTTINEEIARQVAEPYRLARLARERRANKADAVRAFLIAAVATFIIMVALLVAGCSNGRPVPSIPAQVTFTATPVVPATSPAYVAPDGQRFIPPTDSRRAPVPSGVLAAAKGAVDA